MDFSDLNPFWQFLKEVIRIIRENKCSDIPTDELEYIEKGYKEYIYEEALEWSENKFIEYLDRVCQLSVYSAKLSVNSTLLYNKFFNENINSITPSEFINFAGFLKLCTMMYEIKKSGLLIIIEKAHASISLNRMIKSFKRQDFTCKRKISVVEYCDLLKTFKQKDAITLLEQIEAPSDIQYKIISTFIDNINDTNELYKLLKRPNVDFQYSAMLTYFLNVINKHVLMCVNIRKCPNNPHDPILEDKHINIDDIPIPYKEIFLYDNFFNIPNVDYFRTFSDLYDNIIKIYAFFVKEITLFTDIENIKRMRTVLLSMPSFKSIADIKINDFDFYSYYSPCKPLDEFKELFVTDFELPTQIKSKKDINEYFTTNRIFTTTQCKQLYGLLHKYKLVDYEEETFESFIYRMCKYNFDIEPQKIIWFGKQSELCQFLHWFCDGGDNRLWKKMVLFYKMHDDSEIKTNGVLNKVKNRTERLAKLIKEFEAIKR